jgi:hypothetical protein
MGQPIELTWTERTALETAPPLNRQMPMVNAPGFGVITPDW